MSMECLGVHSRGMVENKLLEGESEVARGQHPGRVIYVYAEFTKHEDRSNVRECGGGGPGAESTEGGGRGPRFEDGSTTRGRR